MQRSDGHAQLIDSGGVDLVQGNGHAVIAGLLDTGDAVSGLAGLDTGGGIVVVDVSVHHRGQSAGVADLLLHSGEDPAVLVADRHGEVLNGGVLSQTLEAPVGSGAGDLAFLIQTTLNAGGHDALSKGNQTLVEVVPELGLLLLGPVGEVGVVTTGSGQSLRQSGHAGAVSSHALDGSGVQRGVAVIGGVAQDVHGENDVVDGDLLTVGEHQILAHLEVVVDSAVVLLDDLAVGGTVVSIVGAVVVVGLALDALHDDLALTVAVQHTERGHEPDILVILRFGEEGGELLVERGITDDQRGVLALIAVAVGVLLLAASGEEAHAHDERQDQCKCSFH